MEPAPQEPSNAGKIIAAVLLIGVGLLGLAMSLCGGFFTSLALMDFVTGQNRSGEAKDWGILFVVTGGGSLVVGLLVIFLAIVAWKRVTRT
jgi:hypothetical protein